MSVELYDKLGNVKAQIKKIRRDLEAIAESADQVPVNKKLEGKINYYKGEKLKKEQKNEKDILALRSRLEVFTQRIEAEIAALNQKKEVFIAKIENEIQAINNSSTLVFYDGEIKKLLDESEGNRIKSQVEIRKEKELEDLKREEKDIEEDIRLQEEGEKWMNQMKEAFAKKNARDAEIQRAYLAQQYEIDKQIIERYNKEHGITPNPENLDD